ncbi:MAG: hypothetical protein A7316_00300 [Candidatus Altiarchaeales archaeon WOR_SM1_86-2]|nr:MAG: hypothetical protein A7316_00300 [Candidatus Altiarchaeales archaeon WOR_SM1_86-2]ODS41726.1 MAG: hypothetical protein A7315_00380 [Candidatus Altiarchaeales archaeon WOR_SM1_79]
MKAKLIDLTRCTECRSCITACENWNKLEPHTVGKTADQIRAAYAASNGAWALSTDEWTVLKEKDPKNFYKKQCMHCDEPMCVKNCPASAITKYDNGAVVVDKNKCEGVKLCIEACPFGVPVFNDGEETIQKCTLCYDRITQSPALEPACVKACPAKAVKFGDRDDMLAYAGNFSYVYGGGREYDSSVIYVSDVPFEQIGLEKAQIHGLPSLLEAIAHPLGVVAVAGGVGLAALHAFKSRKEKVKSSGGEE